MIQRLRVQTQLDQGDSGAALTSLMAPLYVLKSLPGNETLVMTLVRAAAAGVLYEDLPALMALDGWETDELEFVQQFALEINLLDPIYVAMQREVAWGIHFMDSLRAQWPIDYFPFHQGDKKARWMNWACKHFTPQGWLHQNMAYKTEWGLRDLLEPYDAGRRLVRPGGDKDLPLPKVTPYTFLAHVMHPQVSSFYQQAAKTESRWDMLAVQCALQRFQLHEKKWPAALEDLVPRYLAALPHDLVTGGEPHFHLSDSGSLFLATLDWDQVGDPDRYEVRVNLGLEKADSSSLTQAPSEPEIDQ